MTSPTSQTTQLDLIHSLLVEVRESVNNDRIFNILEVVRDEVNDLSHEHQGIRSDISELRNLLYQQSSTGAD